MRRRGNRGMVLIASSYLVLAMVLVYTNVLTLHTVSQRQSIDRLRDGLNATNLVHGAVDQYREDLFTYVNMNFGAVGDTLGAMVWLDQLQVELSAGHNISVSSRTLTLPLDLTTLPIQNGQGKGSSSTEPRTITLPSQLEPGQAWLASVSPTSPPETLARNVTIEGMATIGGVTKRLRMTYWFGMRVSDVFRYGYFVNNYGWLDAGTTTYEVNGDIRANGNLRFTRPGNFWVQGDLYASNNPDLIDPTAPRAGPATGTITGDPSQRTSWTDYWNYKASGPYRARPARSLTDPSQPTIGIGSSLQIVGNPFGWDSEYVDPRTGVRGDQHRFTGQAIQEMPYLGDLQMYRNLAAQYNSNAGSTLRYYPWDPISRTFAATPTTLSTTNPTTTPLVLIGDRTHPITIDGPFVTDGDAIIRGTIAGRGTLYVGRNLHVVGSIDYLTAPSYPPIERNVVTGQLREYNVTNPSNPKSNLGIVCNDGEYIPPGGTRVGPGLCM